MDNAKRAALEATARNIRSGVLEGVYNAGSGHPGPGGARRRLSDLPGQGGRPLRRVDEGGEACPHQGGWGRFNKVDFTAYPSVSDGQRIPRHPEDFGAWSLTSGSNQRMELGKVSPREEVVKLPSLHL